MDILNFEKQHVKEASALALADYYEERQFVKELPQVCDIPDLNGFAGNGLDVVAHYDKLIDDNNDPFRDPHPMQEYMDKWDGQLFIDSMCLSNTKKVLEVGIGTGRLAAKVAPYCLKLSGIDISPKTINRAKENLSNFKNITFILANFLDYVFNETFDVIYSSLTMMHFENKRQFIFKVSELLNKNGIFCLSIDKNPSDYIDMGDYKLKVYPDKLDEITEHIHLTDMNIINQFETEFAHIIICSSVKSTAGAFLPQNIDV